MKKLISAILIICMLLGLSACGSGMDKQEVEAAVEEMKNSQTKREESSSEAVVEESVEETEEISEAAAEEEVSETAEELETVEVPAERKTIFLGAMEQDNNTVNGDDPIEWIVLDEVDGKALVVSSKVLFLKDFNPIADDAYETVQIPNGSQRYYRGEAINWENSTLRAWLNSEFIGEVFTENDLTCIVSQTIPVDEREDVQYRDDRFHNEEIGNDTEDTVFLLSLSEVEKYFPTDEERQCELTDSLLALGETYHRDYPCEWWLRTSGWDLDRICLIETDGFMAEYEIARMTHGVRPAMWVDMGLYEKVAAETPASSGNAFADANVGDIITFGNYAPYSWDDVQPIEWIVLDKQEDRIMVISRLGLAAMPYHNADGDVTWETSAIREYLNGEFIDLAFSEEAQKYILTTTVTADANILDYASTDQGNDTEDKVFLLSLQEAQTYFSSDYERRCGTADAAMALAYPSDLTVDGRMACWWLLRTVSDARSQTGGNTMYSAMVNDDGSIAWGGENIYDNTSCIRPAMWISLE